jgi:8-oxo-dGTP diphosphatase
VIKELTRIAAYGLILRQDEMLLCRTSYLLPEKEGYWTLPGGGIEHGEHPEAAMVREVHEETGLHVRPVGIAGVDAFVREQPGERFHGVRIYYHAEVLGGSLTFEQDGTTDMCHWWRLDEVPGLPLVDLVEKALPWVR